MSADPAHRRQLGELLVEKGVLTDAQLQLALAEQARSGEALGEILVRLGYTQGPTIGNALAEQHGGPLRTEYGLALGPSQGLGMAPGSLEPSPVGAGAAVGQLLRVADPAHEQDRSAAQLTEALDERTQELERVRIKLAAVEQHGTELASARADLKAREGELAAAKAALAQAHEAQTALEQELEQARGQSSDESPVLEELRAALEARAAELADAEVERTTLASRAEELERQLEQARAERGESEEAKRAQDELRAALEHHQAELAKALEERAELVGRVHMLEGELEHARAQSGETEDALRVQDELRAELLEARDERAAETKRADELQQLLEQARAQADEAVDTHDADDELRADLEQHKAELLKAQEERTAHAGRADELEQLLEEARATQDDGAEAQRAQDELRADLELHKGELLKAQEERTAHAGRADELEQLLEEARATQDDGAEAQRAQDELRADLEHHKGELATAKTELEQLLEQARAQYEETAAVKAELVQAREELEQARARNTETEDTKRSHEELQAEQHRAELTTQHAGTQHTLRGLELTLEEHKAELAAMKAELSQAHVVQTRDAARTRKLEEQLDEARTVHTESELQQALVAAARERAERRYGPPLRTAGAQDPEGAADAATAPDDDTSRPAAPTHAGSGITIKLWQLALFIVVVPALLYFLVPISAVLATASVVLLAALIVLNGRRSSRAGAGGAEPT